MKKISTLIVLLAISLTSAWAHTPIRGMEVENLNLQQRGEQLQISFTVKAEKRAVKSNYSVQLTPVLIEDGKETLLPAILIDGRRVALSRKRTHSPVPLSVDYYYLSNGGQTDYSATVPFAALTPRTDLVLRATLTGCCSVQETEPVVLASAFVKEQRLVIEPVYETIPYTTGEILAKEYGFVAPLSDFERQSAINRDIFIDDNRDQSLSVYFRQSERKVDPTFRGNQKSIEDILYTINALQASKDSKISHIVIAGFASPEGNLDFNERLAYNRAIALRDYIGARTGVDNGLIDIYNGGVDWYGLGLAVKKSTLPEKDEVLHIIENAPINSRAGQSGRQNLLKQLNGGRTYPRLMNEFYPELRNATYIRIYYENR